MKNEANNAEPVWHSGPPPSCGWWPASRNRLADIYRYWNGRHWSRAVSRTCTAKFAATEAAHIDPYQRDIKWADRPADWPEHART